MKSGGHWHVLLTSPLHCLSYLLFLFLPSSFLLPPSLQFQEFCIYAHSAKPTEETPKTDECIQLFNGITTWVVSNILWEFTMVKRAAIIEKFIECTRVSAMHISYTLSPRCCLLDTVGGC